MHCPRLKTQEPLFLAIKGSQSHCLLFFWHLDGQPVMASMLFRKSKLMPIPLTMQCNDMVELCMAEQVRFVFQRTGTPTFPSDTHIERE